MENENSGYLNLVDLLLSMDVDNPDFISLFRENYTHPHEIELVKGIPRGNLQLEKASQYTALGMMALMGEGNAERAVEFFEKGLEESPNDPHAYFGMGLAHNQLGDRFEAYYNYTKSLEEGGVTWALRATALANRASTFLGVGKLSEALRDSVESLRLIEDSPESEEYKNLFELNFKNLVIFWNKMQDYKSALSYCDLALTRIPNIPSLMLEKANALIGLRRYNEATRLIEKIDPSYEPERVKFLRELVESSRD